MAAANPIRHKQRECEYKEGKVRKGRKRGEVRRGQSKEIFIVGCSIMRAPTSVALNSIRDSEMDKGGSEGYHSLND